MEDDLVVSRFLHDFLARDGHIVLDAAEGGQAFEILSRRSGRVDLVITDMIMAGVGGAATISLIRDRYPKLKIVAMSGGFDKRDGLARQLGVDGILRKPFMPAELRATVRAALA